MSNLPKYKQTEKELNETLNKAKELRQLLQTQCPHNHIEEEHYVNDADDYGKTYSFTYKCTCCGLVGFYNEDSFVEPSETFLKLKKKYIENKKKKHLTGRQ